MKIGATEVVLYIKTKYGFIRFSLKHLLFQFISTNLHLEMHTEIHVCLPVVFVFIIQF
jgi:hypothetical protein